MLLWLQFIRICILMEFRIGILYAMRNDFMVMSWDHRGISIHRGRMVLV